MLKFERRPFVGLYVSKEKKEPPTTQTKSVSARCYPSPLFEVKQCDQLVLGDSIFIGWIPATSITVECRSSWFKCRRA